MAAASQAFGGVQSLIDNQDDVFAPIAKDVLGSPLDKLLIIAVLTSASASTQTTILPATRTSLSMARKGALAKRFGDIHPRYLTPSVSTIWMGAVSVILGYVFVKASIEYSKADGGYAKAVLGVGSPVVITVIMILLGVALLIYQHVTQPEFFTRKPEPVDPEIAATVTHRIAKEPAA